MSYGPGDDEDIDQYGGLYEDDEPKKPAKRACTQEQYWEALEKRGGTNELTVLSSYTYIDDPGFNPFGPGRHIYTEWGTKDGQFVAEHEEHNGEHTYRQAETG